MPILLNEKDKSLFLKQNFRANSFLNQANTSTYGLTKIYHLAEEMCEETIDTENSSNLTTVNYSIDGDIAYEIGGKIQGFGGTYQDIIPITFGIEKNITDSETSYFGFGYLLQDDDESDYLSVDIKESNVGWGPILENVLGKQCVHMIRKFLLFLSIKSNSKW